MEMLLRRVVLLQMDSINTLIASMNSLNECDNDLTIEPIPNYTDYVKNSVESNIYLSDCSSEEIKEIIKELSLNKASDIPIQYLNTYQLSPHL